MQSAVRFFENVRYELGEVAVAANHVHALVRTAHGVDLSSVLGSWKRHSSTELRRLESVRNLFPKGTHLWQAESFDNIVQKHRKLERYSNYIRSHDKQ